MNAESDNPQGTFADQLARFGDELPTTGDDLDSMTDVQEGIGRLLAAAPNGEGEIRRILQQRLDEGALRKETFSLVSSMLDSYITENTPTSPTVHETVASSASAIEPAPAPAPEGDDDFGVTTIIPANVAANVAANGANGAEIGVGSVLRERFLLQEKVSGGSMGVVYKALDRRLAEAGSDDHWVAIKILSPQLAENAAALRALQQEAAKGRRLVHPNIVRFIDLDRDNELYFLVMEWLEGRTLAEILDSGDAASIDNAAALRIVRELGEALDYAHRSGIVHADVKPGNVMILPDGTAKLFDFGVARVRLQQSNVAFDPGVLGALTPAYSSMQVLTGEEPLANDDVFSLACLLYRLVAGYRVFGPRNAAEASEEGMQPQRPQTVTDNQWRVLKRGLSYPRVTRFDSAREFLDALQGQAEDVIVVEARESFAGERGSGPHKRLGGLLLLLLLGALAGAAYKLGLVDTVLERLTGSSNDVVTPVERVQTTTPAVVSPQEIVEPELVIADVEEIVVSEPTSPVMGPETTLVDFSKLPAATVVVEVSQNSNTTNSVNVVLRENDVPAIVDFVRDGDLSQPRILRLEEVGFSGNRSPWASGQYSYSGAGVVSFPAGQARARVTLSMAPDPLREADQQSTLRLRESDFAESQLAILKIALEDDDQRVFESQLPLNTVAFAVSQASIRETDPAVQIDVVRFNPDDTVVTANFTVNDITATEGEDYFAPGNYSISFGPGQRSRRLLIPLVQDADVEGNEAFVIELSGVSEIANTDIHRRIVVVIRDDEPQQQ